MKALLIGALFILGISGCIDDGEGPAGDADADLEAAPEEEMAAAPPEPAEFTFGPGLGCDGSSVGPQGCLSWHMGSDVDAVWVPLGESYWGADFDTDVDSQTGDTDCFFLAADGSVLGDAHNGPDPCRGTVPEGTEHLFLFSWAEPHQGMTVTFKDARN